MVARKHSKLEVATEQMETALRLYFEGKEYFSVVTLAGAAEEILGAHLKIHGQKPAFVDSVDSSLRLYEWLWKSSSPRKQMQKAINRIKNGAKHMEGRNDSTLVCDEKAAARRVLDRAVSNYYMLMEFEPLSETELVRRFNSYVSHVAAPNAER